jgi:hypothetical protein
MGVATGKPHHQFVTRESHDRRYRGKMGGMTSPK